MADNLTTPETAAPGDPNAPLPLSAEQLARWKTRIEKARAQQKLMHPWWQECRDDYVPSFKENPKKYHTRIRTNRNYKNVHRKAADLIYQRPELTVEPSPLLDGPEHAQMVATHAEILNAKIGRAGINIKRTAHKSACDWLIYGAGCMKVGYHAYTVTVSQPDPISGKTISIPVPIPGASQCFLEDIGPKAWLRPADWRSTEFDRAPWLAWQFELPKVEAKRRWGPRVPEDIGGTPLAWDALHFDDGFAADTDKDRVTGVEIWYLSHLERPDRPHPQHYTVLVLLDGAPEPVEHRDSPYQELDPRGGLTPNSMIGNPIHPILLRVMTDSSYVQSDVAVALPLTHELDTHREQGARQREITTLKWFYDKTKLPENDLVDALGASQGGAIGVSSEVFDNPNGIFKPLPDVHIPPDNYQQAALIDNDLSQTSGIDANSSGVASGGSQTATESNIVASNVGARMAWEQGVFTDCLLDVLAKYATLLARYLDVEDAAYIVGAERAQQWKQWVQSLKVRLAFGMVPDSSLRNDTPLDRKQWMDLYTYLAREPLVNRAYFLQRLLFKWHVDPTRALMPNPPPPPQPQMEPPKLSFNGDDLGAPQAPIVAEILKHYGIPITPEAVAMTGDLMKFAEQLKIREQAMQDARKQDAQPEHGGKQPQAEGLDKHQAEETGGMQNTGMMMPGMAGPSGVN